MNGQEAKTVLRMLSTMLLIGIKRDDQSESMNAVLDRIQEAIEIACVAIDMNYTKLEIEKNDDGGKND